MSRLSKYVQTRESRTQTTERKAFPPWEATHLRAIPQISTLENMRDGEPWKLAFLIRVLPREEGPYQYSQCWLSGAYRIGTSTIEGFEGHDLIKEAGDMLPRWADRYDRMKDEELDELAQAVGVFESRNYREACRKGDFEAKKNALDQRRRQLYHRPQYAMPVVDFRYYHAEMTQNAEGYSRMIYHACTSDGPEADSRCSYCSHQDQDITQRIFGGQKIWSLSDKEYKQIVRIDDEVSGIAVSDDPEVHGRDRIQSISLYCPECGDTEFVGEAELSNMTQTELLHAVFNGYKCGCGYEGQAAEAAKVNGVDVERLRRASLVGKCLKIVVTGEKISKRNRDGTIRPGVSNTNTSFIHEGQELTILEDDLGYHGFNNTDDLLEPMNFQWEFRPEKLDPSKFNNNEEYVEAVLERQQNALLSTKTDSGGSSPQPNTRRSIPFGKGDRSPPRSTSFQGTNPRRRS